MHTATAEIDQAVSWVRRARGARQVAEVYEQARVDEQVAAAGWAILVPGRNRDLTELAAADTGIGIGIGNLPDKVRKSHRKTLGLPQDLQGALSVAVIHEDPASGLIEIARPVGIVCAETPSTNPAAIRSACTAAGLSAGCIRA